MRTAGWLVFVIIGCGGASPSATTPAPAAPAQAAQPSEPEGIPAGYVEMRAAKVVALGDGAAVLLVDDGVKVALPIFIGGTEGMSIDLRLRGDKAPRPLTHDLLDSVLRKLDAKLVKVQVDALRDGVFHGSVFIRANMRVMRIDARPSDAIALAIGNRVPIYVAKAVLDEAGIDPNTLQQHTGAPTTTSCVTTRHDSQPT